MPAKGWQRGVVIRSRRHDYSYRFVVRLARRLTPARPHPIQPVRAKRQLGRGVGGLAMAAGSGTSRASGSYNDTSSTTGDAPRQPDL
ncbi:MAG: hypothetical protein L0332_34305 [Chloroflexi bacterium]|nr:hypothetical protein [Chloroflexota bacterium]